MQGKYSVNHRYSAAKRRTVSAADNPVLTAEALRLFVCVVIIAAAVTIKLLFPDFAERAGDRVKMVIGGDVDYQSAIEAVGSSLSGGENIIEAFSRGYETAFSDNGGQ